jgi:dihydroorotase
MSLTKGMEGKELSALKSLSPRPAEISDTWEGPLMLSEDGKDVADDALFLAAMKEAARAGIPVSCHCDFGGEEAEAAKKAGKPRSVWSRIEENNAVRRVIELGRKAQCHIHIAHVSTKEAIEMIRRAKEEERGRGGAFTLTCEVMPHNLCLTEEDAKRLGEESWGRVNPPLRCEEDRLALIRSLAEGFIDAIATDHAPHSKADKEKGAPGFSGFETAFAAVFTELVRGGKGVDRKDKIDLKRLSSLMSAGPARLLGFGGSERRGRISPGYRADLVIVDPAAAWIVIPEELKTKGKNSPFAGRELFGKVLMTLHKGRVVF